MVRRPELSQAVVDDRPLRIETIRINDQSISKGLVAAGIFLLVLSIYVLTSPGRIDIVDGQARYDVAYNWIVNGRPILQDKWLLPFMSVLGRDGFHYSFYGAPGSVFAMPLVWLGLYTSSPAIEPSQFLFSLTSAIFGAAVAPLLFLFYLELGVTVRKAFLWTMVSSFATLVWPVSNSSFDNAQHTFFVLAAVYFGFLSARRRSISYAVLGGLMAAVLLLYQEYFLLIIPALALSTVELDTGNNEIKKSRNIASRCVWTVKNIFGSLAHLVRQAWHDRGEARSACIRYCAFLGSAASGVLMSLAYNALRFGSPFNDGKFGSVTSNNVPLFGNPVSGLLTLLISPGKSIFLYSSPIVIGILGWRFFTKRYRSISLATVLSTLLLLCFLSWISFVGGDWCWGPRYLTILLPLWALAFPFASLRQFQRPLFAGLVALGLLIQGLALTVENQRYFFENGFHDYFWSEDSWVYFKHSALFSRVEEVLSLADGVPTTAKQFNSIPIPDWTTYAILGPPADVPRIMTPTWIRKYQIYYLPRPWPFWASWLPPSLRPINVSAWLTGLIGTTLLGALLIYEGFRRTEYK